MSSSIPTSSPLSQQSPSTPNPVASAGLAISIAGFIALYSGETSGPNSIVNQYATIAYLSSGLVGGVIYWLFSGRVAGDTAEAEEHARQHGSSSGSAKAGGRA